MYYGLRYAICVCFTIVLGNTVHGFALNDEVQVEIYSSSDAIELHGSIHLTCRYSFPAGHAFGAIMWEFISENRNSVLFEHHLGDGKKTELRSKSERHLEIRSPSDKEHIITLKYPSWCHNVGVYVCTVWSKDGIPKYSGHAMKQLEALPYPPDLHINEEHLPNLVYHQETSPAVLIKCTAKWNTPGLKISLITARGTFIANVEPAEECMYVATIQKNYTISNAFKHDFNCEVQYDEASRKEQFRVYFMNYKKADQLSQDLTKYHSGCSGTNQALLTELYLCIFMSTMALRFNPFSVFRIDNQFWTSV